jgi:hypothetical protein
VILIELNLPDGSMHTVRSSRLGKLARAPAPVPSQLRFITTRLLHRYRFRLHCVPLRSGSLGAFSHPRGDEGGKLIPSAAQPRNRVGIRRRRTTPVKAARRHAPRRRLRSEMLAIFLLSHPSPPIPNLSDIYVLN